MPTHVLSGWRRLGALVLAVSLALLLGSCAPGPVEATGVRGASQALDALAALPIKGRAPKTGYDRDLFGQAWADVDRNGCDTRNDILKRDLTAISYTNSVPCKVQSGTLADPYTAKTIAFVRGTTTSSAVQIDHVVALSDAWQKGAQQLSLEKRTALANDPLNLQATDGPTNQQKGDGDAATWLPPSKAFRCEYVARQISVKAAYKLWVTQAEHDAMARILGDCPA
ncbi:HNH endonuclease family protein [Paenarthrobacter sp. NPDC058040]|uniref:HNH endonuclease family protein n=1 Tax=Paenarthrobacter sp. NPDC058040 TaxID=3346309 RepID=UPI0036DA949D